MTQILSTFGLFGTITLMFAAVGAVSILVVVLLLFIRESNIKKIGMTGAEFYDDHPVKHRVKKTPVRRK